MSPERPDEPRAIQELRKFLPEWGYPSYVIAAICLELKERLGTTCDHDEPAKVEGCSHTTDNQWCEWCQDEMRAVTE